MRSTRLTIYTSCNKEQKKKRVIHTESWFLAVRHGCVQNEPWRSAHGLRETHTHAHAQKTHIHWRAALTRCVTTRTITDGLTSLLHRRPAQKANRQTIASPDRFIDRTCTSQLTLEANSNKRSPSPLPPGHKITCMLHVPKGCLLSKPALMAPYGPPARLYERARGTSRGTASGKNQLESNKSQPFVRGNRSKS